MYGVIVCLFTLCSTYVVYRLLKLISWYWKIRSACLKIPGPKPHWLFGNLREIPDSLKYTRLAQATMNQGHKIYCLWAGPWPFVGTAHPDTAKILLRSSEPKAKGLPDGYRMIIPWIGEGLLVSDGALWERSRKLLTPAFHFEVLRDYVPIYNRVSDEFMDSMWKKAKGGDSIDVFEYVSKATLDTMLRCAMSYEGKVQDSNTTHPYVSAVNCLTHLLWLRLLSPLKYPDFLYQFTSEGRLFKRHCKFVHEFTEEIITKRRLHLKNYPNGCQNRHLDFLDILLQAKDDNDLGLTDLEIRNEVDTFTFEGHDTTASAVSWAIYALGKHQSVQEAVFKEVESVLKDRIDVEWSDLPKFHYLTCFIKETLRYYSPVPITGRSPQRPLVIDGIEIPVGPRVEINIYCIHHNPDVWPDHMEFKPDRFDRNSEEERDPYAFVPFAAGPRNCIGQHFVMDEIKVLLARLVKRFSLTLDPNHQTDIFPEVVTRSTNGIKAILQER